MSTGILHLPERADLFHWSDTLDPRDYPRAIYVVTSLHAGDTTGSPWRWNRAPRPPDPIRCFCDARTCRGFLNVPDQS